MRRRLSVSISELAVDSSPAVLYTYGLGSCVGIVLYDPLTRMGGLAHPLLPSPGKDAEGLEKTAKYASWSVELLVEQLMKRGCAPDRLVAKLAGGASMFDSPGAASKRDMGALNVAAARSVLERYGIAIVAEDVGGNYGRSLEFQLETGELIIRSLHRPEITV